MIDIILAIALTLGTLTISEGPAAPTGPVPVPPTSALNSAQ
ncbi:MAG: hypothetical protein JWM83_2069 [Candidatus Angelobacter sp.]|jgi:hypothetical protein|nr:hypothetical protein [Candidatus Angelobacter sp.]